MWVFTTSGFVSVVKESAGFIKVRSRDAESLKPIATCFGKEIERTPLADYPYRLHISKSDFKEWLLLEVENLEYSNFKSEALVTRGGIFAKALSEVWSTMHRMEDKSARSKS